MPSPWLISGSSMMSLATQLQSALCKRLTGARMSSFPPHCRRPWVSPQAPLLLCFNKFWVLCVWFFFFFLKKISLAQPGLALKVAVLGRLNLDARSPQPVLPKCWSYRHYHLQPVFHSLLKKLPKEISV